MAMFGNPDYEAWLNVASMELDFKNATTLFTETVGPINDKIDECNKRLQLLPSKYDRDGCIKKRDRKRDNAYHAEKARLLKIIKDASQELTILSQQVEIQRLLFLLARANAVLREHGINGYI